LDVNIKILHAYLFARRSCSGCMRSNCLLISNLNYLENDGAWKFVFVPWSSPLFWFNDGASTSVMKSSAEVQGDCLILFCSLIIFRAVDIYTIIIKVVNKFNFSKSSPRRAFLKPSRGRGINDEVQWTVLSLNII